MAARRRHERNNARAHAHALARLCSLRAVPGLLQPCSATQCISQGCIPVSAACHDPHMDGEGVFHRKCD
eukprot:2114396-Lingulodinium_polyedra.AAC.1